MNRLPRFQDIDLHNFSAGNTNPPTKYGLPQEIRYCKSCIISNQRPNSTVEFDHNKDSSKETINIDSDQVCDACKAAQRKHLHINWDDREKELVELCNEHRRTDGRYDCVLPGSGGKDSFYAAHILKHKYGMNPLTITWAPHLYTDWGLKNFHAWIHAGFDNVLTTPNGRIHRLLTRLAVETIFHPFQPFMIGQKALAPKMSALYDIPLVFFGENEAEYGNPVQDNSSATRDWKYFTAQDQSKIHLGGVAVTDLKSHFGVTENDLQPYLPISPEALEKAQTSVHYLGYYLKWHPQDCYYYAVEHGGFIPSQERTAGTYSKYNSIDDKIDDLHYFTTRIKFGIGRATYDAAQEIRSGDILREEGLALAKRYDHEFPERFIDELLEYLSLPEEEFPEASKMFESPILDREYFMHLADRFRSPHLWKFDQGEWSLRKTAWSG